MSERIKTYSEYIAVGLCGLVIGSFIGFCTAEFIRALF